MRLSKESLLRWLTILVLVIPTTVVTSACGAEGEVGTDTGGGGGENVSCGASSGPNVSRRSST